MKNKKQNKTVIKKKLLSNMLVLWHLLYVRSKFSVRVSFSILKYDIIVFVLLAKQPLYIFNT